MTERETNSIRDQFISHLSIATLTEVLTCLQSALEYLAHEAAEDGDFKQEKKRLIQAQSVKRIARWFQE